MFRDAKRGLTNVKQRNEEKRQFRGLNLLAERAVNSNEVCGCRMYVEVDNAPAQARYLRRGFVETGYKIYEDLFA